MKYAGNEVISDSEAAQFARNLCKKRWQFATFDDALLFVHKIRTVVSNAEYARMNRANCARLAWEYQRDERTKRPTPPTPKEVAAATGVRA